MIKRDVVILGTCTNQKSGSPSEETSLDSFPKLNPQDLASLWIDRLNQSNQLEVRARDLYIGSAWNETLACLSSVQQYSPGSSLWVLSAGWGLIPVDAKIKSYSATFAQGEDSIHNAQWELGLSARERNQIWWKAINSQRGADGAQSIMGFSEKYPDPQKVILLLILSPAYFQAIETEVNELVHRGYEVAIFSAGVYAGLGEKPSLLRDNIMPINDKYKQISKYLNHTNVSLNARVTNWVIQQFPREIDSGVNSLREKLIEVERELPEMERKPVVPMTDEEVLEFIGKNYVPDASSASQLLKVLRHEENKSCERKRFAGLFKLYEEENRPRGLFDL